MWSRRWNNAFVTSAPLSGEANCTFEHVVRVRYILPNAADFPKCWPALRRAFGTARPAATMLAAGLADPRMLIEIEVTARRPA